MSRVEGPTAERFVETTLDLIAEEGGSLNVNLRQISRRLGFAHTNLYNYFDSYQELLWAAFREGLDIYAEHLIRDISGGMTPEDYVRQVLSNLASFPEEHTGLYRLIGSDPIDVDAIPEDILETVSHMKGWLIEVLSAASGSTLDSAEAATAADIVLAYIDGETLNLINGRVIPTEDLRGRIVSNAMRLFTLLAEDDGHGVAEASDLPDPRSIFLPDSVASQSKGPS